MAAAGKARYHKPKLGFAAVPRCQPLQDELDQFNTKQQQPAYQTAAAAASAEDSAVVRARIARGGREREVVVVDGDEAAAGLRYKHAAGTK